MFIHDALDELITCGETDIAACNLQVVINKLSRHAEGMEISGFENQFEVKGCLSECHKPCFRPHSPLYRFCSSFHPG